MLNDLKNFFKDKTYNITTFGCQMNEHDSERISYILEDLGYTYTSNRQEADFILFNTCLVRENAELKLYGQIGSLKHLKKQFPNKIISVCGCMMQTKTARKVIEDKYPEVDIVFGTKNINALYSLIHRYIQTNQRVIDVSAMDLEDDYVEYNNKNNFQAYVNIMRGCNNFCSFCIVPHSRGREESRRPSSIIEEVESLVNKGYKEINLLGQNVNSYGNNSTFNMNFPQLLDAIANIPNLKRIRFTTSHPKDLSDDLIKVMAKYDNICNYFHLPLQSGSNKVLKDMNRHYTIEKYLDKVKKLRNAIPNISLSTDLIVGYPTETENDFKQTIEVCKEVEFDSAYTFIYSKRPGTKSYNLKEIDREIIKDRFDRLLNIMYPIFYKKNQEYIGKTCKVLIENISKNNDKVVSGRTEEFRLVNVKGSKELIGKIVDVKINKNTSFTLEGELC